MTCYDSCALNFILMRVIDLIVSEKIEEFLHMREGSINQMIKHLEYVRLEMQ
jgi:hypothetical protein